MCRFDAAGLSAFTRANIHQRICTERKRDLPRMVFRRTRCCNGSGSCPRTRILRTGGRRGGSQARISRCCRRRAQLLACGRVVRARWGYVDTRSVRLRPGLARVAPPARKTAARAHGRTRAGSSCARTRSSWALPGAYNTHAHVQHGSSSAPMRARVEIGDAVAYFAMNARFFGGQQQASFWGLIDDF